MRSTGKYVGERSNTSRIETSDHRTIVSRIKDCDYGDHNLILYHSLKHFEEFYSECCKDSIQKRDEIFVIFTRYQHVSLIREKMRSAGIDASKHESDGSLVILDSEIACATTSKRISAHNIVTLANMLTKQVEEHDKKGITLVCDLGTLILKNRIPELISYEQSIPNSLIDNVRPSCCYHKDDFELLLGIQRKIILEHHTNNLIVS